MNHGLIAPQFGLGGVPRSDLEKAFQPAPSTALGGSDQRQGPTVVIKRRRLVAEAELGEGPPAAVPAEGKRRKVYRLDQPAATFGSSAPTAIVEAGGKTSGDASAGSELSKMPPVRRRRDPIRQPTLVRHVVFETPPHERPEVEPSIVVGGASRAEVLAAMEDLRRLLDALVRGRDAYLALDEYLSVLGVPSRR